MPEGALDIRGTPHDAPASETCWKCHGGEEGHILGLSALQTGDVSQLPLSSPPGYELLPYECHEGNYMVSHSLSAEREEDAAIAADLKKGIVRKRKSIQQNLDAGARPIPGRANPNDDVDGN